MVRESSVYNNEPVPQYNQNPEQDIPFQEEGESLYSIGTKVLHAKFGSGIVLNLSGSEEDLKLEVFFKAPHGKKKLLASHAKLIIL